VCYLQWWGLSLQFCWWISNDANSWGHLQMTAGPMLICIYQHRSSSPCRGFAKTNVLADQRSCSSRRHVRSAKTFVLVDLRIFTESSQNAFGNFGENSWKIAKHLGYFLWSSTENNTYRGHEKWSRSWTKSLGLDLGLDKSLDISKPCCK